MNRVHKLVNYNFYAIEFQVDGGEITEKEFLPVKQLRFGDTGSHLDEKEGRYTLGPLLCEGDGKCFECLYLLCMYRLLSLLTSKRLNQF